MSHFEMGFKYSLYIGFLYLYKILLMAKSKYSILKG